ncbi:MAG: bifunctional diaminohydroxyphosphoribosylaminopyrimidine deaminase/5-amino-6-(5-phosphoribosylamino)uracil reductase RibD [Peptoniphilaceae bacterium]|nr:bifunctional diaminohydroxyphosphoribosylaminopyrimidine deaminase/5-amino-6-(5-phosphoribosylamino)uracil reductase RibD [Peptoniphilaceae bacterium]MDY6085326.1 bifunctional diaminohydroxyphosphoribosylaminopyrimidine deaminase/5-amino-6-(5-phosphoribosylamino)uracil reductase RibD [Peptoniphilaceae bacterium]
MNDEDGMRRALALAARGVGWTNPNPMVGAVIVKDGRVIGEGYHHQYGGLHAEREALKACAESPEGATMVVTLEPCCHEGKQPPCTEAILNAGIRRVVIGSNDPNPLVAGKGIAMLRTHGVEVKTGVLQKECDAINEVFFHYIQTKRPYVVMKFAMTLDGKIATRTGASQWITGEAARARVHEDRNRYAGIMVGISTVLADDPLLTCRLPEGRNPVRIICDTHLRTPLESQIVQTAQDVSTILVIGESASKARIADYEAAGCSVWTLPEKEGAIDLSILMARLGEAKIDSVLLEGGGTLNESALRSGIVQRVQAYIAPKLFGGRAAKSPIEGWGVATPSEAVRLKDTRVMKIGEDFLIEGEVDTDVHGNC